MVFTVSDFNDLKQLLAEHPEWRVELRHLLLSEDFEALPGIVRELAEAQRRTEQRLAELAEAQHRHEERLARLEDRADRMQDTLGRVHGTTLEIAYRQKAADYFGRRLRRTTVIDTNELRDRIEAHLSGEELDDVLLTDLIVRARAAHQPGEPEVWLAVEVSAVVDRQDVARAVRRAELMRRAGLSAVPVVAGENATEGAEAEARNRGAAMLQDGTVLFWDEAMAAWPVA